MKRLVADIETNGLKDYSVIWVLGIQDLDTREYSSYVGEDEVAEGLIRLSEADLIIGHHFRGYDSKVIRELTDGVIDLDPAKIDDTLDFSRLLFPKLHNHKLKTWGEIFGYPKIEYNKGFDKFHPDMIPYCERDVRLNTQLYEFLLEHFAELENVSK